MKNNEEMLNLLDRTNHVDEKNGLDTADQLEKKRKKWKERGEYFSNKRRKTGINEPDFVESVEIHKSVIRSPELLQNSLADELLIQLENISTVKDRITSLVEMLSGLGVKLPHIDSNMTGTEYEILISGDHYFAIVPRVIYRKEHMLMRLGQDIDSGSWHIIKSYQVHDKKLPAEVQAEVEVLKAVNQFTGFIHESDTKLYVIKPYIYGKDLSKYHDLDLNKRIEIFAYVTTALLELHQKGILHCDIKLENIIFDQATNTVTFIDFDVALKMGDLRTATTDLIRGTFGYLAPELLNGRGTYVYTEKTDVYAFGKTMEEWLDLNSDIKGSLSKSQFFQPHLSAQQLDLISLIKQMTHEEANERSSLIQVQHTIKQIIAVDQMEDNMAPKTEIG